MSSPSPSLAKLACPFLLFLFLSTATQAQPFASAKFTSCRGCRLNHLPHVRKFFKEVVEPQKLYGPDVKVFYVQGKTPTLDLLDSDGKALETIDVSGYTFDQLHQLLQSKGFQITHVQEEEGHEEAL